MSQPTRLNFIYRFWRKLLPRTARDLPDGDDRADAQSMTNNDSARRSFRYIFLLLWAMSQRAQTEIKGLLLKIPLYIVRPGDVKPLTYDNTSSPQSLSSNVSINCLPPELISWIAEHVPDDNEDARSIVPLTHVCRYWRESISWNPGLWTRISNRNRDLATFSLNRSKGALLEIRLNMVRRSSWFHDTIQPHIQKIGLLETTQLRKFEDLTEIFPDFPQSTPSLHSLVVSILDNRIYTPPIDDPFKPFPSTLRCLSLSNVPPYQSLLSIRTLTKFTFQDHAFGHPLETLLTFLEENNSLKHVELSIEPTDPLTSSHPDPIRSQLQYLSVESMEEEVIRALITCLPLQEGGDLKITHRNFDGELQNIISDIHTKHPANLSSSTCLYLSYSRACILLSGPNGSIEYSTFPGSADSLVLSPFSFEHIQELHLQLFNGDKIHKLPLFPALKALTVDYYDQTFDTLWPLLPSPDTSPSLKTLTFRCEVFPRKFMKKLIGLSSGYKTGLDHVIFVCHRARPPNHRLVLKLKKYVLVVEIRGDGKLPMDIVFL